MTSKRFREKINWQPYYTKNNAVRTQAVKNHATFIDPREEEVDVEAGAGVGAGVGFEQALAFDTSGALTSVHCSE